VEVDHTLPLAEIGPLLDRLSREEAPAPPEVPSEADERLRAEVRIAEENYALDENIMQYGSLSPFTCPECHGVLTALRDGPLERYRCHTGHAYSSGTLLNDVTGQAEARLWDAVRALDESVMLLNRMGEHEAAHGDTAAAETYFTKAREALQRARAVREAATANETVAPPEP